MEKIPCICKMRELCKAISCLEDSLMTAYGVSLNEAMVLCCISGERATAGYISQATGIKSSHLSKVLRSVEEKDIITRAFGDKDKRQVYFTLTQEAAELINSIKRVGIPIPELLKPFFD